MHVYSLNAVSKLNMTEEEIQSPESEIPGFIRIIIGIILGFCVASNSAIVVKIVKASWKQFRPLNVYQLNYFSGFIIITIIGMILVLSDNKSSVGQICPVFTISYFLNISNTFDIVILQLDRLMAVRKPLLYKTEVDAKMAVKVVAFSKIFSLGITIIGSINDPVFIRCPECERHIYVHSVNVYTVAYPSLAAFILTMSVSVYVSILANRFNTIQPQVPRPTQSHIIHVIPLRNCKLSPIAEESSTIISGPSEGYSEDQDSEHYSHKASLKYPHGSTEADGSRRFQERCDEINLSRMVREIDRRKTFTAPSRTSIIQDHPNTINTSAHKMMLKKTLKMNLLTLAIFFYLVPIQILTIMYENCDPEAGECDTYFHAMLIISILQIFVGFLHPLVVLIILGQQ